MKKIVNKHSSGGVLIKDGKVLLIHWSPPRSTYDLPKGSIDEGETPEIACIREVREETGYDTKIVNYIGQTYYEYDWIDGTFHKKIVDYFLLETDQDKPDHHSREPHETFENVWVTPQEAVRLLSRDVDKEIVQKALLQYTQ